MPIAVLTAYTEKEYEPFDSYSHFCPAMPVSVCFSDTALCTLGKPLAVFYSVYRSQRVATTIKIYKMMLFVIAARRQFSYKIEL